jgi:signal transduction histidine kinase
MPVECWSPYGSSVATIDRGVAASPAANRRLEPAGAGGGWWWWRHWFESLRPGLFDALLALGLAVVQVAGTVAYSHDEPSRWAFDVFAGGLLVVGPAALVFRRRWPEVALVVTCVAAAGYAATGYPRGPVGFPAVGFAVVSAIVTGRRAFAWAAVVVAYPAFVGLPYLLPDKVERARSVVGSAALLVWLPIVGVAAEVARLWLERRAERAKAVREEARRRASEGRLLIAQELHDVLAHNIALISVQSGVALHLLDERPEQVRPALEAINAASDEALGELRSVLDVLHGRLGEHGASGPAGAPRDPTAGLRDLDVLIRRTRAAGLDVALTIEGESRPVPAAVDLAALRIVQEALTNVVRHAGGGVRATVRVTYRPSELVVQVDDDGPGPDPAVVGGGRGIVGMRDRVDILGGTFAAGPRPGRGFRVRARIPVPR